MSEAVLDNQNIVRHKKSAFEKRIHEIDFIRGFLIALVLMDHVFCHCLLSTEDWYLSGANTSQFVYAIYKASEWYWNSLARDIVRFFALFGFTFISGVSCAFSRNNWVRAGQMLALYFLILVGSNVIEGTGLLGDTSIRIDFNVIGVLAWSTLFYCFAQNKTWRSILVGALISFLLFFVFIPWLNSINGVESAKARALGLVPMAEYYAPPLWEPIEPQADWMPLVPYTCFFFLGALFSYFFYAKQRKSLLPRFKWEKPICFMGRHSLLFYLGHQAILVPIFMLLDLLVKK